MKRWEEEGWQEDDLNKLELSFLHNIFRCQDTEGVDGTLYYAKYLNKTGVNADNYPAFLEILAAKNHWVIDALLGDKEPETFFQPVQPNYYILKECFKAFSQAKSGGVYPKNLLVYMGILEVTYQSPLEGYRVYPVTATDVNNLGKHLDADQDQLYPVNKSILTILDKIASLIDPGRPEENEEITTVATQANNIRGKFLDITKSLNEAIPDLLLEKGNFAEEEVSPSQP